MFNSSLEICCYSVESARRAARAGAQRVELCAGRTESGITPSAGYLHEAVVVEGIRILPILRPRGGDFCYSDAEFRQMLYDLEMMQELGFPGVVTGVLLPNGRADLHRMSMLKQVAGNMEFCVHRCIDMSENSFTMLEELIQLGVKRVLSSGRYNTAVAGIDVLKELNKQAGNRIEIMAGSGVNSNNILQLKNAGIKHFHASAGRPETSPMTYR
ncbi:MAG: copper homeostasis protein CutC, partial [Bacteroidetes bacterium]|nr:copper homeostasis protein CutC [Bacteroidota bacterium]